jgi:hypothetical protein
MASKKSGKKADNVKKSDVVKNDVESVESDVTDVDDNIEDVDVEDVETKKIIMVTKSLKGGDLPDGFEIKKPTITLTCDMESESFPTSEKVRTLFTEGARVRAQRVLRAKGKAFLEGKTKFSLKLSELFEKSTSVSTEAIVDKVITGDIELTPQQEAELYKRIAAKYGNSPLKK